MTGETAKQLWPSARPPAAPERFAWDLDRVAALPLVRAEVRAHLAGPRLGDLCDRLVLALDEMASNALRHGGPGVSARVAPARGSWLVEVVDSAAVRPPSPAIGRDPSQGGLGLYLIAEMSTAHGWSTRGDSKSVWALLPR